ncbi:acyl-CoA dehydrogenase family protein [Lentzea sp. BCCO 10_0798]|uniref:Acyl-CoA dehydrogenase family protein n=1 Tax=Lentzea kristufekii TaxID=3095430 RepID=A0ABU4TY49_9PSEU|nr:acyl-CoA dehydrogenase family protein [Lentzea sp. BCCO 10_0798]MDX8053171.1 acyl-CoA dehydrogenase family protein [Lentzea sp. BCCO 10_0798]
MITKDLYERKELRQLVRDFTRREIAPHLGQWERDGEVPRELHKKAAELDLLGIGFEHGDLLDSVALTEEIIQNGGSSGLMAALFTLGIAIPHIWQSGNEDLIERFAKPAIRGEKIGSLAVTEPGAGSDVAAIRTRAVRDGDHYVVTGEKTFITSGCRADFVTTAVRTGGEGYQGISLLVIEDGFTRRKLDKMGWHCSDTAELHFDGVRVPVANLVGQENQGFALIMQQFQVERVTMAVEAYATAQRALDLTVEWVRNRETFGKPLIKNQVVRHKLAHMAQKIDLARTYTREVAARIDRGDDCVTEVCFAKNAAVDACSEVVDEAVQLHGGMGYMRESEVERHYRDARILGIGGGASEVMTELAARRLGFA